ncbi:MAG: 3,4-dihydroxy-2-butanone-4-phosphate synthase [Rhodospirillales bacterium]|jgi:3,4-dihydroxy 2-butanone 4-phosphate synthase/GTP cyclohydrolase II|nr:3,4-dihydroxy-2-butanone-4-phosphate synthase [Rhodospirillaceae bacterium]MDP6427988.1 3,4-dihydroxy-2-butanone-4-phosphate synthase [Rhodospirillales bacterium]MDP6646024.1 3,4-dihydroxy-2-butanone-4-phosphate synthase [Rhodospirillales bacterium]MDP6841209.1 3,4-dihydroxy-2-butanone-4-phosphate synthase [Rhodospirillales bacterium]|tara:strand:+ start:180 stop:1331 length:1152 start_codon:yes stop_codon:yes gene_type:complete
MPDTSYKSYLASVEEIIEDARNGRMFILVDEEDRENEGDLVIPAQMATPDVINFMATHGRGLICLSLTERRISELGLTLMTQENEAPHQTAFTVSIEAREGVDTGISAPDRARTIATAIDPTKTASDIVSPGHVFPLKARKGGVLVRAGHTEAAVDISRLAGLNPAGVICEIMKDDGTMARMPDLVAFAQRHNLKIGTIADLISYRLSHDRIVQKRVQGNFKTLEASDFKTIVYANDAEATEHLALVKGDLKAPGPILVRMHAFNIFDDIYSAQKTIELHRAMELIEQEGRGVIVMIRSSNPTILSDRLRQTIETQEHPRTPLREYGVGAQILLDLGVHEMILLSSTVRNIVGLEAFGLTIVEQRPITIPNDYTLPVRKEIYE